MCQHCLLWRPASLSFSPPPPQPHTYLHFLFWDVVTLASSQHTSHYKAVWEHIDAFSVCVFVFFLYIIINFFWRCWDVNVVESQKWPTLFISLNCLQLSNSGRYVLVLAIFCCEIAKRILSAVFLRVRQEWGCLLFSFPTHMKNKKTKQKNTAG